ncbi:acyloxyacyl hydrolase [Microbulbifer sp.]|uniref:acyloxyacyl hydrolase n=1 Tax=Microbulbifer sp. TaxID=1908541 RepID=UPI00258CB226|nr:acyloxyacyl hydrolase [Microbulbifer sp.]
MSESHTPVTKSYFFGLLLILAALPSPSHAEKGNQELILSGGGGMGNFLIQQDSNAGAKLVGANWSYQFYDYPSQHHLQWWAQVSYSYMWDERAGGIEDRQHIVEVKPVLRMYPSAEAKGFFGEAGLGAAYLDEREFGNISLSTNLNFSMHFAAGYTFPGDCAVSLRYSHFSNGYTNTPNPGFDFFSLNWHIPF